jgi:hypothetical protein
MKIFLRALFFVFYYQSLISSFVLAQVPSNPIGLNPNRLKWNQINTDKVQVVFPKGLENQGQRVANIVHYLWDNNNQSLGDRMKKVTILLQNQTTIPNGFVTVGPFRSEFFMTPPQFNTNSTADWLDLLAVHEYRHVKQFANADRGVTRFIKTVLGSWAWGGLAGTALPRWFWEGDAVAIETALTNGGRGRLPEFDMEYKSLIINDKRYGYEKAQSGSLKDFVPDWYALGYYMVGYARQKYGDKVWRESLNDAVRYKGLLFPLSTSLKRKFGVRTPELYRAMRQNLDSMWKLESQNLTLTSARKINQQTKRTFTNYQNPQYIQDGSIIAEKSSFNQIRTYYRIFSDGTEEKLTLPGINVGRNTTLSFMGSELCWTELGYDPRWGYQNFSNIKVYNLEKDRKFKITTRGRYFAPALSKKGDIIVAIETPESLHQQLHILDRIDGKVLQKIANPDSLTLMQPRFNDEGDAVIVVAQKNENHWLVKFFLDGKIENLTEPMPIQLSNPFPRGEYVYFSGAHTGINNIFAVKTGSKDLYQITSVRLGAFQPAVNYNGDKLVYSEFSVKGYDLQEIELKPETWQKWEPSQKSASEITFYKPLVEQEGGSIMSKISNEKFPVKKYNKWSGLINPHSILPYLLPPVSGARILFDNKFSTLSGEIGVYYNNNEKELNYSATLNYAQLYPVISVNYDFGARSRTLLDVRFPQPDSLNFRLYNARWQESDISVGLSLPLNLTQGTFFRNLRLSADYHWININTLNRVEDFRINGGGKFTNQNQINRLRQFITTPIKDEQIQALDINFRFSSNQTTATQNILPKWGYFLNARYRTTLGNTSNQGNVWYLRGDFYFPGLFPNHSFFINTAYQKELYSDNYKFRNLFFNPRGYGFSLISDELSKIGFNYTLPLLYPDLPLGSLAFLKRIKANLFFDMASARLLSSSFIDIVSDGASLNSTGVELTFDMRLLRLLEADFGFRYSYVFQPSFNGNQQQRFEFILLRIGI